MEKEVTSETEALDSLQEALDELGKELRETDEMLNEMLAGLDIMREQYQGPM